MPKYMALDQFGCIQAFTVYFLPKRNWDFLNIFISFSGPSWIFVTLCQVYYKILYSLQHILANI